MVYDSEIHHRRSIRAKGYDYAQDGAYFATVCAQNRQCLFGDVDNGRMKLNRAGEMVKKCWINLKNRFSNIETDTFVMIPNHFHGIFWILNLCCRGNPCGCPNLEGCSNENGRAQGLAPTRTKTVGNIIGAFKSLTTNEYIKNVKSGKFPVFEKAVWQKNYWEHIIRDDNDLNRVREYIANNPLNWEIDELYAGKLSSADRLKRAIARKTGGSIIHKNLAAGRWYELTLAQ